MFKKEYRAFSYNEAVELANLDGFTVMKNKTVAWENAGRPENIPNAVNFVFKLASNHNCSLRFVLLSFSCNFTQVQQRFAILRM